METFVLGVWGGVCGTVWHGLGDRESRTGLNSSDRPDREPLISKSDQCLISPYSNTVQSNIKVVRKKEVINK